MDVRWTYFGVTEAFLEEKSAWLTAERELHHSSVHFFRLAGKLVALARDDYEFTSLAFFQAIIGLERALRLHFSSELHSPLEKESFSELLARVVEQKLATDAIFSEIRPFSEFLQEHYGKESQSRCHTLAKLIPKLRNEYMHGGYYMSEDTLFLTIQMREIADVLNTKRK